MGENRTIVALGLKDLVNSKNLGLRALMEVARNGRQSGRQNRCIEILHEKRAGNNQGDQNT